MSMTKTKAVTGAKKVPSKLSPNAARRDKGVETVKTVVFALLIALIIRTFLVQAFRIPSGSMEDTLLIGDFLLVDKITYGAKIPLTPWRLPGFRKPKRGDILVFKDPRTNRDYIKRCIALPGETFELRDNEVYIDGRALPEPYKVLKPVPGPTRKDYSARRIGEDKLFMMGDNRNNSQDSRYWNELDFERVVGRAFVLYWSSDPEKAPRFVQSMSESWVKGFLQLFFGRPRLTRFGKWLATDYTRTYEASVRETP
jgi:signal peptidase I